MKMFNAWFKIEKKTVLEFTQFTQNFVQKPKHLPER